MTEQVPLPTKRHAAPAASPDRSPADIRYDLIELLFFAYRDFVGQPDEILTAYDFGRAHHRVLHFVNRNPGMKVADLLDILRITKQSLGRVLKQLIDEGFIVQKEGARDRRQRLLYPTASGQALAERLVLLQSERVGAALAMAGDNADESVRRFLFAMICAEDRDDVARIIRPPAKGGDRTS